MSSNTDAIAHPQLSEIFNTSLQEIYWAETHLSNVMSSMSKASTATELRDTFNQHAEQTQQHAKKLEEVFSLINAQPYAKPSIGLQGLFDEGWRVIDQSEEGAVRDVALLVAAQKVEHYEIACYGSLVSLAKKIGQEDAAKLLAPIFEEVKSTGAALSNFGEEKPKKAKEEKTEKLTATQPVAEAAPAEKKAVKAKKKTESADPAEKKATKKKSDPKTSI